MLVKNLCACSGVRAKKRPRASGSYTINQIPFLFFFSLCYLDELERVEHVGVDERGAGERGINVAQIGQHCVVGLGRRALHRDNVSVRRSRQTRHLGQPNEYRRERAKKERKKEFALLTTASVCPLCPRPGVSITVKLSVSGASSVTITGPLESAFIRLRATTIFYATSFCFLLLTLQSRSRVPRAALRRRDQTRAPADLASLSRGDSLLCGC